MFLFLISTHILYGVLLTLQLSYKISRGLFKILFMTYDRQKYLEALKVQLEPNIYYHSLALEACMGGIYDYLHSQGQIDPSEPSRDDWLLAGLIHDIDYSGEYKDFHPNKTVEVLHKHGLEIPDVVLGMVKAHAPDLTGVTLKTKADWAIFCADSLTGLIVAVALVYPSKKLADVKLSSVVKRFLKEPKFAAGTRRSEVAMCSNGEGLNIPLEKFIEICLLAMQKIAGDMGL
jgi:predicted hydrolase (HD superfamily)